MISKSLPAAPFSSLSLAEQNNRFKLQPSK
jgi:hypothetical protein